MKTNRSNKTHQQHANRPQRNHEPQRRNPQRAATKKHRNGNKPHAATRTRSNENTHEHLNLSHNHRTNKPETHPAKSRTLKTRFSQMFTKKKLFRVHGFTTT